MVSYLLWEEVEGFLQALPRKMHGQQLPSTQHLGAGCPHCQEELSAQIVATLGSLTSPSLLARENDTNKLTPRRSKFELSTILHCFTSNGFSANRLELVPTMSYLFDATYHITPYLLFHGVAPLVLVVLQQAPPHGKVLS